MGWVKDKGSSPQFKEGGKIKKYQRGGQINPLVQPEPAVPLVEGNIPSKPIMPPIIGNNPGGDNQTSSYAPHDRTRMGGDVQDLMSEHYYEEGGKVEKKKLGVKKTSSYKDSDYKTRASVIWRKNNRRNLRTKPYKGELEQIEKNLRKRDKA